MTITRLLTMVLALVMLLPAAAAGAPLDARLEADQEVVVCGPAAGADLLLWGAGYRREDLFATRVRVAERLKDPGRDGCFRHQPQLLPPFTLVAVDAAHGELFALTDVDGGHRLGTGGDRLPFPVRFSDRALTLQGPASAEVLLLRPGQGVWLAIAADGGPGDADGTGDGAITLAVDAFRPVAGTHGELRSFAAGDIAAVLDLDTLAMAMVARTGL